MLIPPVSIAIIGAGPAGLMAAQVLSEAGLQVDLFDAMPSVGRKFLLAGRGGLNLTHSEPYEAFVSRYGARQSNIAPLLQDFGADALRAWATELGVETFIGTSGRVFPKEMKAAPLLRSWLQRLRHPGMGGVPVRFHMRHRLVDWAPVAEGGGGDFRFQTPAGEVCVQANVAVLALGGASWPRLGSDGAWAPWLAKHGIDVAPLIPANCGFDVALTAARRTEQTEPHANEAAQPQEGGWSAYFRQRFAGQPLKSVAITVQGDDDAPAFYRRGEFVVTTTGVEGSLVYAASALLRDELAARGSATMLLDLLPAHTSTQVLSAVQAPRDGQSLANHLRRRLRLDGVKTALLHELLPRESLRDHDLLARAIKALPVILAAPRPIEEAISTAGGVRFEALDEALQIKRVPGVFCAGEMLDWEAPTGGYLLTACMASGVRAARGVLAMETKAA
ncbi:TIGR03862 family flavoprotein [Ottowia thiooxydans]|uniref:TIGR03862 family flavoprotein n=1 Tax=Ottowia thiooxydans TaxID=219182 RepID=UPI00048FC88F|nr:TIGR03862 family flavoprotein [Ottowia thiooxydans]